MNHSFFRVPVRVFIKSKRDTAEWIFIYRQNYATSIYFIVPESNSEPYFWQTSALPWSYISRPLEKLSVGSALWFFTQFIIPVYLTSFPSTVLAVRAASDSTLSLCHSIGWKKLEPAFSSLWKQLPFISHMADRVTGFSSFPWIVLVSCTGGLGLRALV